MISLLMTAILTVIVWNRTPLFSGEWNKQTIYVALLDVWHGLSNDDKAYALWIDDDGTEGIFNAKKIAETIGIKPCFAVIANKMTPQVRDSLVSWQQRGSADIALHGFNHERWKEWSDEQIELDIRQSIQSLHHQGFDTTMILPLVVPPHSCNTRAIRYVISQHGFQMITGASLVNPDRHVFQMGRISITKQTDTIAIRQLLQRAYSRKAFVIFGTHSANSESFSEAKTHQVLSIAKEIGFCFDFIE